MQNPLSQPDDFSFLNEASTFAFSNSRYFRAGRVCYSAGFEAKLFEQHLLNIVITFLPEATYRVLHLDSLFNPIY